MCKDIFKLLLHNILTVIKILILIIKIWIDLEIMEKDDHIKPFSNITNFNYAIIIVLNLYSKITQNYIQIKKCICKLVQPIELTATINFVTRLQH